MSEDADDIEKSALALESPNSTFLLINITKGSWSPHEGTRGFSFLHSAISTETVEAELFLTFPFWHFYCSVT